MVFMMNIKPLHIPIKVIQKHLRLLQFVQVQECPFKAHIHKLYNPLETCYDTISFFFCSETLLWVKLLYSSLQCGSSDHPKFSAFRKAQQAPRAPPGRCFRKRDSAYLTRGEGHRTRRRRGHHQRHYHPTLHPRRGTGNTLRWRPSPLAGEWLLLSQTVQCGPP